MNIYLQLGLSGGDVQTADSLTEEKEVSKKLDFCNRPDIAEVKAKVGS